MYGLTDFYIAEALAKAIARRQDEAEARKLEQPARPSLLARLRSKFAGVAAAPQALYGRQPDEPELSVVQCE